MKTRFMIIIASLIFAAGCGKLEPRKLTADMLGIGDADFYEDTVPVVVTSPAVSNTVTVPIANVGIRNGNITRIQFSDTQYTADVSSVCVVGTEVKPGESCDLVVVFTPTGPAPTSVNATLTIDYENGDDQYSSDYPLQGTFN